MSEQWEDIKRKSQKTTKLHPDMGECVIEIRTTAVMPDRWISHLKSVLDEVRCDRIVYDEIVARAEHPKAVPHVLAAIDGAIRVVNARYRIDLGHVEARRGSRKARTRASRAASRARQDY